MATHQLQKKPALFTTPLVKSTVKPSRFDDKMKVSEVLKIRDRGVVHLDNRFNQLVVDKDGFNPVYLDVKNIYHDYLGNTRGIAGKGKELYHVRLIEKYELKQRKTIRGVVTQQVLIGSYWLQTGRHFIKVN